MPELPEVETVVNSIRPEIVGRTVTDIQVNLEKMLKHCNVADLKKQVIGQQILAITRRGKYFIINVDGGWLLIGHLRMTGRLTVVKADKPRDKYTHIIFSLENGTELRFADMRQFGCLYLIRPDEIEKIFGLATLGPEPLAHDLTLAMFRQRFNNRRVKIKQLLLNQQFVAGIGNIYADEILFAAGINPSRQADGLTEEEIAKIFCSMRHILTLGIKHRGTSVKDYVDGFGAKGEFQEHLKVYGRTNQACFECGAILTREKIGGRSTHYCPNCQH